MSSSSFLSTVRNANAQVEKLLHRTITALSTQRPWQLAAVLIVSTIIGAIATQVV